MAIDLSCIRSAVPSFLTDTLEIITRSRTSDGAGGWTHSETSQGTFKCRYSPASQEQLELVGGSPISKVVLQVVVELTTPVNLSDIVVIEGKRYEVKIVLGPRSNAIEKRFLAV